ncbi:MAG: PrsW family glutamic-type intramembrane protease [Chloroflexota bacterium]
MQSSNFFLTIAKILTIILGLIAILSGGSIFLLYGIGLIMATEAIALDSTIAAVGGLVFGVGLGSMLVWHGASSLLERPSSLVRLPAFWILLVIYIPVLIIGQIIISYDFFSNITFPPIHLIGAVMPALIIVTFAINHLRSTRFRWRDLTIFLSGGIFVSPFFAIIAEVIFGGLVLITTLTIAALLPGGLEYLTELADDLQNPAWIDNPNNVEELLAYPPVYITLIAVFVVIAPIFEELFKLIAVMLSSYRHPSRAQIFVWGLMSGAGFALMENTFNTLFAVEIWAGVMLLRIGATTMHCFSTGLFALGWHSFITHRQVGRLIGLYSLSVLIHALWNGLIIGITGFGLSVGDTLSFDLIQTGTGLLIVTLSGLLLLLGISMIGGFIWVTRKLQKDMSEKSDSEESDQLPNSEVSILVENGE